MNQNEEQIPYIRFRTPEQLQNYLVKSSNADFSFRTFRISGEPETFHYNSSEHEIFRETDGASYGNPDAFTCYAFKCDAEGYANTEYVDFEMLI